MALATFIRETSPETKANANGDTRERFDTDVKLSKEAPYDGIVYPGDIHPKTSKVRPMFFGLIIVCVVMGSLFWRPWTLQPPAWQENFYPINYEQWSQPSAVWEDAPGKLAVLRENNPAADFGKVETKPINVDISAYPILRIRVKDIDLHTSYTVQILDKQTDMPMDVLKGIDYPGEVTVDLAEALGWEGSHAFTINIWIAGEGNTATFELISVEAR